MPNKSHTPPMLLFSKSDFAAFVKEAKRVIALLGLQNWHVDFVMTDLGEDDARCRWTLSARSAVIILTSGKVEGNIMSMRERAILGGRHEALELLMAPMGTLLSNFISETIVDEKVHDVVRRLENVL